MSTTNITLVILGAFAAGICIGLLIAPEKGSETRKRVVSTIGDCADKLKEVVQSGSEEAEELTQKAKRTRPAT